MKIDFKIKLLIIIGIFLLLTMNVSAYSEPDINVDPTEPEQLSEVTFTVTFDDYDDVNEVFILYNECTKNDICYTRVNKSLNNVGNGNYEITVNLEHDDSFYVQYWVEFNTDEGWKVFPEDTNQIPKTYLKEKQTNGGSNNNGQNNDTPGFEIFGVFISIILIMVIINIKKR
jgi:hypothetical protein